MSRTLAARAGLSLSLRLSAAELKSASPARRTPRVRPAVLPTALAVLVRRHRDVEKIDREQILITVTLDHLVSPEKVELGLTHYIVWFAPVGEHPLYQQALDYDAETMVGRASIPTSLREFEVQVTAENSETPNQPSDLLMASQKIREN